MQMSHVLTTTTKTAAEGSKRFFKLSFLYLALALFAFGLAVLAPVHKASAQVTIPVILVIDRGMILNESDAGKNLAEQAKTLRETIAKELETDFAEIQKEQKQLEAQVGVVSDDVLGQRTDALRVKVRDYDREQQLKNREYQASVAKATGQISQALQPILTDILKTRSATILLDSSQLLFASPEIDITAEAMKKLNEELQKVELVRVKVDDQGNIIDETAGAANAQ